MTEAEIYAKMLFEAAKEAEAADIIAEEIKTINRSLDENPLWKRLMDAPDIRPAEKQVLIDTAFGKAHPYVRNMLKMLSERRMMHMTGDIFTEYRRLYEKENGIARIKLTLPAEIDQEALGNVIKTLEGKTGKRIIADVAVDTSLIGGMRLEADGQLWDSSIITALGRVISAKAGKI